MNQVRLDEFMAVYLVKLAEDISRRLPRRDGDSFVETSVATEVPQQDQQRSARA